MSKSILEPEASFVLTMTAGLRRELHLKIIFITATLLTASCTVDPSAPAALTLRDLDFNDFACKVQPITAAKCSMLACHGVEGHALRIYTPGKLRINPMANTLDLRDEPIHMSEVQANFAAMRGLAPVNQATDDTPLLHKSLAPAAGGGEHKGGGIFHSVDDAGYVAIKAFLDGEKLPGGCAFTQTLAANP